MSRGASQSPERADEARIERVWRALDERLGRRERQLPYRRAAVALGACCAAVWLCFLGVPSSQLPSTDSPQVIELADGSRIEHATDDQIELEGVAPERVVVRVVRGSASFSVTPNPAREFLTHAAGYTVRVLGTQYRVGLEGSLLRVQVWRGLVEVRSDAQGDVWRVRAGETWTSTADRAAPPVRAGRALPETVPIPEPASVPSRRGRRAPAAEPVRDIAPSQDAAALFERAQQARMAGRPEEAAETLDELLLRFPRDQRAGVSAFELARLRLDLGDAKGALDALDRARSAGYALAEQVEMRRVQALEALGDLPACRAAREAFLARFPNGTFRTLVSRRCP